MLLPDDRICVCSLGLLRIFAIPPFSPIEASQSSARILPGSPRVTVYQMEFANTSGPIRSPTFRFRDDIPIWVYPNMYIFRSGASETEERCIVHTLQDAAALHLGWRPELLIGSYRSIVLHHHEQQGNRSRALSYRSDSEDGYQESPLPLGYDGMEATPRDARLFDEQSGRIIAPLPYDLGRYSVHIIDFA